MHIYACPVYTREHRKIQQIRSETYFLKRFPPFKRFKLVSQSCCHFIYCTLCNTVSFNSSCALPTAGLVNIELFLLQTTYCMWKEKLFSSSRSYFFTLSIFLQKAVFPGAGYEGITEYKSVIYYQVKQPCWNETVKVQTLGRKQNQRLCGYVFEVLKLKSLSYDSQQHSLMQSINLQHNLALFCVQVKRCDL